MSPRIVLQTAIAEFRERTRQFHLLLVAAGCAVASWMIYADHLQIRVGVDRGLWNGAWTGAVAGAIAAALVSLGGFFYLRGSVARDYHLKTGLVLGASPVRASEYVSAKFLANLAVVAVLSGIFLLAGPIIAHQANEASFEVGPYLANFAIILVPAAIFVAAAAVLFDTCRPLRGGFGNVLYCGLWGGALYQVSYHYAAWADVMGFNPLWRSAHEQAAASGLRIGEGLSLGKIEAPRVQVFEWTGFEPSVELFALRMAWVVMALVAVAASVWLFDRFDPDAAPATRIDQRVAHIARRVKGIHRTRHAEEEPWEQGIGRLSPLGTRPRSSLAALPLLVTAELRLMLRSIPKPVLAVFMLLNLMAFANRADGRGLLGFFWVVPVLLWSRMGARDAMDRTSSLLFVAPRSSIAQAVAVWFAGVVIALAASPGIGLGAWVMGDTGSLVSWLVGACFVSALALACGVWAGTDRLFQALYLLWWMVAMNGNRFLDFMDMRRTQQYTGLYAAAVIALLALALFRRLVQYERIWPGFGRSPILRAPARILPPEPGVS